MVDRIIIRNTDSEAKIEDLEATDVLGGEMLLVREVDKERLYCKNSDGEISKIHRVTNCGEFEINLNVIEISHASVKVGDVCAYDGKQLRAFRFVDEGATYNIKNYNPVGIVVVPTSHNVYGDESYAILSLHEMDCDNPQKGTNQVLTTLQMPWGPNHELVTDMLQLDSVVILSDNINNTPSGFNRLGYIPTTNDYKDTVAESADGVSGYKSSTVNVGYAPSPYLKDGSRNPVYYQHESETIIGNRLSDFDGISNTNLIIKHRGEKDYSTWKPSKTTSADYPAASCCNMYYTENTKQGDWYLPATGELGYFIVRLIEVAKSIRQIEAIFGIDFANIVANNAYWSSTQMGEDLAGFIHTSTGYCGGQGGGYQTKGSECYARAFLRVKDGQPVRE